MRLSWGIGVLKWERWWRYRDKLRKHEDSDYLKWRSFILIERPVL